jgi:hypothetical protein
MANILEPVLAAIAALEKRVAKLESAKPKKAPPPPKRTPPPEEVKTATIRVPWGKKER